MLFYLVQTNLWDMMFIISVFIKTKMSEVIFSNKKIC